MDEIKRTMRVSVSYLPPHPFHNILCAVDFPRNRDLSLFCACHKSGHVIGSVPRSYRTYARTTRRNFEARCAVHENRTGTLPVPGPSSNAVHSACSARAACTFSVCVTLVHPKGNLSAPLQWRLIPMFWEMRYRETRLKDDASSTEWVTLVLLYRYFDGVRITYLPWLIFPSY